LSIRTGIPFSALLEEDPAVIETYVDVLHEVDAANPPPGGE
jgi:hypothetical protein